MAFTPETLGVIVQPIGGDGMRFISYRTDDDQATVAASEYFANASRFGIRVNDLIFVSPVGVSFDPYIMVVNLVDTEGNVTAAISAEEMPASIYDPDGKKADAFDQDNMADGTTNKNYTATEQAKLSGIEPLADVTDATNVAAAGAAMAANDLSDLSSSDTALSNLGGGTSGIAVLKAGDTAALTTALAGAVDDAAVRPDAAIDAAKLSYLLEKAGAIARSIRDKLNDIVSVEDFGAVHDGVQLVDGSITASDKTLTSATASFVAADVGKYIEVAGAGAAGNALVTTIASINSTTSIELTDAASTTVSAAIATYGTDDTAAIQKAIDSEYPLLFPKGLYLTSSTLMMDNIGQWLIGQGMGETVSPYGGTGPGTTTIRALHTSGAAIRVQTYNCGIDGMRVDSGLARAEQSYSLSSPGVWCEATDTGVGVERVASTVLMNIHSVGHPGDPVLMVGEMASSYLSNVIAAGGKGIGLCFDGGDRTSRTNRARPGIVILDNCKAQRNGCHALAIGSPNATAATFPYRFIVNNFESFGNNDDSAHRYSDEATWLYLENSTFNAAAFGGSAADGTNDAHRSLYIAGRASTFLNCRYINSSRAVTIGQRTIGTDTLEFLGMTILNSGTTMNPAVVFSTGVKNIEIKYAEDAISSSVTNVVTPATAVSGLSVRHGDKNRYYNMLFISGAYNSFSELAIADDTLKTLTFGYSTYGFGVLELSSDNASIGGKAIDFRIGSSNRCVSLYGNTTDIELSTTITTAPAATDGKFTITATSDGKILLINRLGVDVEVSGTIRGLDESTRLQTA